MLKVKFIPEEKSKKIIEKSLKKSLKEMADNIEKEMRAEYFALATLYYSLSQFKDNYIPIKRDKKLKYRKPL